MRKLGTVWPAIFGRNISWRSDLR